MGALNPTMPFEASSPPVSTASGIRITAAKDVAKARLLGLNIDSETFYAWTRRRSGGTCSGGGTFGGRPFNADSLRGEWLGQTDPGMSAIMGFPIVHLLLRFSFFLQRVARMASGGRRIAGTPARNQDDGSHARKHCPANDGESTAHGKLRKWITAAEAIPRRCDCPPPSRH